MTELLRTLFVTTAGTSLHLEGDTVRLYHPEQPGRHVLPLIRINHLVVFRGVDVSNELMLRCTHDDRGVTWLSRNGRFLGRLLPATSGNPLLRLEQARAYDDPQRRLHLAKTFVAGKIQNYRQLLLRAARDAPSQRANTLRTLAAEHAEALTKVSKTHSLTEILGLEGQVARSYFQALPQLASGAVRGRSRRPPQDPVNCLLSFGYSLLRTAVTGALEHVGLDPYIGYLHGARPGKPSLALDVMEEFRPLLVDRTVLTLCNRKQIAAKHTITDPTGGVQLTDEGRKLFLNEWSRARQRNWPHPTLRTTAPAGVLPLLQARLLARHLRGDQPTYQPWIPT